MHFPRGWPITTAMPSPSSDLRALLADQAELVLHELGASCAAISCWERDRDVMRTLVNVGELEPEDEAFPEEELYPLDTFPAVAALLRFGRPYLDPPDVSSSALAVHMRFGSHAAVPLVVDGRVWGELWVAAGLGGRRLAAEDVITLANAAEPIGRLLAERPDA
jgi:GAF domain-containing protein